MEKSIILISTKRSVVYHSAIAICSLMYPFKWALKLIPILPFSDPIQITNISECPQAFIFGVTSQQNVKFLESTIIVNLDNNLISNNVDGILGSMIEKKQLIVKLSKIVSILPPKPDPNLNHFDEAFLLDMYDVDE